MFDRKFIFIQENPMLPTENKGTKISPHFFEKLLKTLFKVILYNVYIICKSGEKLPTLQKLSEPAIFSKRVLLVNMMRAVRLRSSRDVSDWTITIGTCSGVNRVLAVPRLILHFYNLCQY